MALISYTKQLRVSELDFEQIKANLKEYFKRRDSKFRDWDWEGSALNNLLDVLAYNTHYNAMLAHLAFNESFMDSAQLRNNVVSHAKLLGYVPRSKKSSQVTLDLVLTPGQTIPAHSKFTSSVDGSEFTFTNDDEISSSPVTIREGTRKTERFTVDETVARQVFSIEDKDIDTDTLVVKVYVSDSAIGTSSFVPFQKFTSFFSVDGSTPVFFLNQNIFGKYEISFGDGNVGLKLEGSNIVEVEYISTAGAAANGCFVFELAGFNGSIQAQSASYGGLDSESIESIRINAPRSLITQNRAVTAVDYMNLIRGVLPNIRGINVWGGEDEAQIALALDPLADVSPYAGKVYISIHPESGNALSAAEKSMVRARLEDLRVFTIQSIFRDPDYTHLYYDVFVRYDQNRSVLGETGIVSNVVSTVEKYSAEMLNRFQAKLSFSNLMYEIQLGDASFLSTLGQTYCYKVWTVPENLDDSQTEVKVEFGFPLYNFNDPDRIPPTIKTKSWTKGATRYYLKDGIGDSQTDRFVYVSLNQDSGVTGSDIKVGKLLYSKGVIIFDGPVLKNYVNEGSTIIEIHAIPNSDDIVPSRNIIISIDSSRTKVVSYGDTNTGILPYNVPSYPRFDGFRTPL